MVFFLVVFLILFLTFILDFVGSLGDGILDFFFDGNVMVIGCNVFFNWVVKIDFLSFCVWWLVLEVIIIICFFFLGFFLSLELLILLGFRIIFIDLFCSIVFIVVVWEVCIIFVICCLCLFVYFCIFFFGLGGILIFIFKLGIWCFICSIVLVVVNLVIFFIWCLFLLMYFLMIFLLGLLFLFIEFCNEIFILFEFFFK